MVLCAVPASRLGPDPPGWRQFAHLCDLLLLLLMGCSRSQPGLLPLPGVLKGGAACPGHLEALGTVVAAPAAAAARPGGERSAGIMASQHQLKKQPKQPPAQPDWRQRFDALWGLSRRGVSLPPDADWRARCALKPFERNLLQNPNPEGVNVSEPAPPCSPGAPCKPQDYEGLFKGWQISTEHVAAAHKEVPPRLDSPRYSWCVKQQRVDLLAEGLWAELLDLYQPNITVLDWYENSKLDSSVYELHVQLLGTDEATAIGEFHHVAEESAQEGENRNWHDVSHVFQRYGPGVRYVHFLHKTKEVETPVGLIRTRATDSSVSVQLRD